ncbi:hypothetical protein BD410DRAFT_628157 [Rickenella mellea]|uniref:Uncharacterized protein n=1 Tax=Rickenella mellea TaxID=50990 RepID=A0A4Y7QC63_9AGAM|nr:hypothetical protein BD410DRAFT_628157 [Rickenella mellea]
MQTELPHSQAFVGLQSVARRPDPEPIAIELMTTTAHDNTTHVQLASLTFTTNPMSRIKRTAAIQLATLCYAAFLTGWGDGSSGPLLPRIQLYYNVGYASIALIFVISSIVSVAQKNLILLNALRVILLAQQ